METYLQTRSGTGAMSVKLGLSSYSLVNAMKKNEISILEVPAWIAEHGGEHIELVPIGFNLKENPDLIDGIKEAATKAGITISNYAVGNNFVTNSDEERNARIQELMEHVDIANQLGVKRMRHDVASVPIAEASIERFEQELPNLVKACRKVADYAAQYDIITSVENHGYFIQAADRVQRLIQQVNRDNFKTTLDVGNFMCVDEDPVVSVKKNLPYASMVHLKDFYLRPASSGLEEGWFPTAGGNLLRGAITGHGDINLVEIIKVIKYSGYKGYISIEFEGMEDCLQASSIALKHVRNLWERV